MFRFVFKFNSNILYWYEVCKSTDDLSHNKAASQNHTAAGTTYGAENAVDRDITTCMGTKPIGPNSPDKTVWWKVDLGGVYNIYSVNILFKNYDGYGIAVKIIKKPQHSIKYVL